MTLRFVYATVRLTFTLAAVLCLVVVGWLSLVALPAGASAGASSHGDELTSHRGPASTTTTPLDDVRSGAFRGYDGGHTTARADALVVTRVLATKGVLRSGASALEDASQASFRAADGPINSSRKHLPGAGGRYNKFAADVDVDSVVREALRSPNAMFRPNPAGGYRIDTDLGRAIGQGGRRTVRTIVSEDGRVITAFPYGPKAP